MFRKQTASYWRHGLRFVEWFEDATFIITKSAAMNHYFQFAWQKVKNANKTNSLPSRILATPCELFTKKKRQICRRKCGVKEPVIEDGQLRVRITNVRSGIDRIIIAWSQRTIFTKTTKRGSYQQQPRARSVAK